MSNPVKISKRRKICNGCKFNGLKAKNGTRLASKCLACGCPLSAKQRDGRCPKGFFNPKGTGTKEV